MSHSLLARTWWPCLLCVSFGLEPVLAQPGVPPPPNPEEILRQLRAGLEQRRDRAEQPGVRQLQLRLTDDQVKAMQERFLAQVQMRRDAAFFDARNISVLARGIGNQESQQILAYFVDQCTELCKSLIEICGLDNAQWEKLNAAAVVDAARLVRRLRVDLGEGADAQPAAGRERTRLLHEASRQWTLGVKNPGSLFGKVLSTVMTDDQREMIYRHQTQLIIDQIDRYAALPFQRQLALLNVPYPKPGEQPEIYVRIGAQQRTKLLELIVSGAADGQELIGLIDPKQEPDLLFDVTPKQLSEFLAPAQVQAVMREKATIESRLDSKLRAVVVRDIFEIRPGQPR